MIAIKIHRLFYRDEKLYPNPHEFSPDRFLEVDADGRRKQKDPRDILFGYGRRLDFTFRIVRRLFLMFPPRLL